jgi:hypothetical protein
LSVAGPAVAGTGGTGRFGRGLSGVSTKPKLGGILRHLAEDRFGMAIEPGRAREWEWAEVAYAAAAEHGRGLVVVGPVGRPSLGVALFGIDEAELSEVDLVAMGDTDRIALEARAFDLELRVWRPGPGGALSRVVPEVPKRWADPPRLPLDVASAAAVAGVDILRGDGRWSLCWRGLEIGEVRPDEAGRAGVALGVGRFDRRARAELGGDGNAAPFADELEQVVQVVARWRRAGMPAHPANQLALGGWLADAVRARPERVGLASAALAFVEADLEARHAFGVVRLETAEEVPAVFVVGPDPEVLAASEALWTLAGVEDPDPDRLVLVRPSGDPPALWSRVVLHARRKVLEIEVPADWRGWVRAGER